MANGRIVQILGGVVDVEFPAEQLPEVFNAVEIPREGQLPLVLEVQTDAQKSAETRNNYFNIVKNKLNKDF